MASRGRNKREVARQNPNSSTSYDDDDPSKNLFRSRFFKFKEAVLKTRGTVTGFSLAPGI